MTTPTPMRGHRAVPHTADIRIEAWAPTRDECIAEAVLGLVDSFADVTGVRPERLVTVSVPEGPAEDILLAVLDEVIYRLEVHGDVPVDIEAAEVEAAEVETEGGEGAQGGSGSEAGAIGAETGDEEPVAAEGALDLRLAVTGTEHVEAVGAQPKAVALHGLRFAAEHGRWSCAVTVDV
ncbi:archease [Streptomyces sp. NPDC051776]|uniref:archease n=1 Tax=Streptomyces sp. NPDC051776 TaxID=3155414 RepID=UPI0034133F1A